MSSRIANNGAPDQITVTFRSVNHTDYAIVILASNGSYCDLSDEVIPSLLHKHEKFSLSSSTCQ